MSNKSRGAQARRVRSMDLHREIRLAIQDRHSPAAIWNGMAIRRMGGQVA